MLMVIAIEDRSFTSITGFHLILRASTGCTHLKPLNLSGFQARVFFPRAY